MTIERGGIENMWGRFDDQKWAEHDVLLGAEKLRGTALYVSTGTGVPGPHETLDNPDLVAHVVRGGPVEAGANFCTRRLDDRLRAVGIPATIVYNPVGVHAWTYWREELAKSWPTLAASLNI
ncbi:hypothetical protein [Rhodococcus sp. OK519]|uniref:hypothetical protein n=1 Tax=Rhodococcus sp. OK519 TaxID=2135729 RepID=UPI00215938FD